MMTRFVLAACFLILTCAAVHAQSDIFESSRTTAVLVASRWQTGEADEIGTGFFVVDNKTIATCRHNIIPLLPNPDQPDRALAKIPTKIKVVLIDGEVIEASIAPFDREDLAAMMQHDFCVLRLRREPKLKVTPLRITDQMPKVGANIIYSGFPITKYYPFPGKKPIGTVVDAMLKDTLSEYDPSYLLFTCKGMVSAPSPDVIGIQGPFNQGNSGGAILNEQGEVVGIVSNLLSPANYPWLDDPAGGIGGFSTDGERALLNITQQASLSGLAYARRTAPLLKYLTKHGFLPTQK